MEEETDDLLDFPKKILAAFLQKLLKSFMMLWKWFYGLNSAKMTSKFGAPQFI